MQIKQRQNSIKQKTNALWEKFYARDENGEVRSFLDETKITEKEGEVEIFMRIFDNTPYTEIEKNEFKKILALDLDRPPEEISLQIVEIPTSAREISLPTVEKTPVPPTSAEIQARYLKNIEDSIKNVILPPNVKLLDRQIIINPNGQINLMIFYLSANDMSPDARQIIAAGIQNNLKLPNMNFAFDRISTESFSIPFENGQAVLRNDGGNILGIIGNNLQTHPRLNLIVNLKPSENTNLFDEKQKSVKEFFAKNWNIDEKRMVFRQADVDVFYLELNQ